MILSDYTLKPVAYGVTIISIQEKKITLSSFSYDFIIFTCQIWCMLPPVGLWDWMKKTTPCVASLN